MPHILLLRVDASLYFVNVPYLVNRIYALIAKRDTITDVVLVCSAVNNVDTSAIQMLHTLLRELHEQGIRFHLAEVKAPVLDHLEATGFVNHLGRDHIFMSAHQAFEALQSPLTP